MKATIQLLKKQHDALVDAIVAIDSQRWPNKSLAAARDAVDKVLNYEDKLQEESDMELTKISLK